MARAKKTREEYQKECFSLRRKLSDALAKIEKLEDAGRVDRENKKHFYKLAEERYAKLEAERRKCADLSEMLKSMAAEREETEAREGKATAELEAVREKNGKLTSKARELALVLQRMTSIVREDI